MIDPRQVLELPREFTVKQLKEQYKRIVFKYHPDKDTDTLLHSKAFHIITSSYKQLLAALQEAENVKTFIDLKRGATDEMGTRMSEQNIHMRKKDFDLHTFNQVFDTTCDKALMHAGYADFLSKQNVDDEKDRALVKYREPVAPSSFAASCTVELGRAPEQVSDWSGENVGPRQLHFMDCKVAYTTRKLVDESTVGSRKEYKTVDDLEKDRCNVSYDMSASELKRQKKRQLKENRAEQARMLALQEHDRHAHERHLQSNKLLLSQ